MKLALTDVRVVVGGMDTDTLESLEERLLAADFGVQATLRLVDRVEDLARKGKVRGSEGLRGALQEELSAILAPAAGPPTSRPRTPGLPSTSSAA